MRVNARVIGAGNSITMTAARDDDKGFKRPRLQVLANPGNHAFTRSADRASRRKPAASPVNLNLGVSCRRCCWREIPPCRYKNHFSVRTSTSLVPDEPLMDEKPSLIAPCPMENRFWNSFTFMSASPYSICTFVFSNSTNCNFKVFQPLRRAYPVSSILIDGSENWMSYAADLRSVAWYPRSVMLGIWPETSNIADKLISLGGGVGGLCQFIYSLTVAVIERTGWFVGFILATLLLVLAACTDTMPANAIASPAFCLIRVFSTVTICCALWFPLNSMASPTTTMIQKIAPQISMAKSCFSSQLWNLAFLTLRLQILSTMSRPSPVTPTITSTVPTSAIVSQNSKDEASKVMADTESREN